MISFRIFLLLISLFAAIGGVTGVLEYAKYKHLKHDLFALRYEDHRYAYENLIDAKIDMLYILAENLASDSTIIRAYRENNRSAIIDRVKPLWDNLRKKGLIKEIHFFKRPAISYVNFSNVGHFDVDVSSVREDMVWVNTSFQPSTHFLVCKTFAGFRATFPIIDNDRMLGGLSVGIDIRKIADQMLHETHGENAIVILEDKVLAASLLTRQYEQLKSQGISRDGYLFMTDDANQTDFTPAEGMEIHGDTLFAKFLIRDFNKIPIGYLVFRDDMGPIMREAREGIIVVTIAGAVALTVLLMVVLLLLKRIFRGIDELGGIVNLIHTRRFDQLPSPEPEEDHRMTALKNAVIHMGKELQSYLHILTDEVNDYAAKAYRDALTGIFNRRALEERGRNLFLKAKATHSNLVAIMIDIDDFKMLNDEYGHEAGDVVLEEVARSINAQLRSDDFFARYGGEEFVVLLTSIPITQALALAKKIVRSIATQPVQVGDRELRITVSAGLADLHETDTSIHDTIKHADQKLYRAKKAGKNRVFI